MPLKPLQVADESGQAWVVYEGDVGWGAARQLYLHGVRELVLPRTLLLNGTLTDVTIPSKLETVNAESVTNVALATLIRRYVRLADCVAYLRRGEDGSPRRDPTEVALQGPPLEAGPGSPPR